MWYILRIHFHAQRKCDNFWLERNRISLNIESIKMFGPTWIGGCHSIPLNLIPCNWIKFGMKSIVFDQLMKSYKNYVSIKHQVNVHHHKSITGKFVKIIVTFNYITKRAPPNKRQLNVNHFGKNTKLTKPEYKNSKQTRTHTHTVSHLKPVVLEESSNSVRIHVNNSCYLIEWLCYRAVNTNQIYLWNLSALFWPRFKSNQCINDVTDPVTLLFLLFRVFFVADSIHESNRCSRSSCGLQFLF